MERMRIVTDNTKVNENLLNRVKELEEENKKLRDYADNLDSENDNQAIEIEELKKENKKLNEFKEKRKESRFYFKAQMERAEPKTAREAEDLQRAKETFEKLYREELSCLEKENKKLKMSEKWYKNQYDFDEECLRKLKEENKKLKKYYDRDKEELMESCYSLAKENKKLKSDLAECECSFGFENDEVGFWKREYKRLKKWIKDHCKGYGNLFPEDEMKRQWKKADKKRK